MNFFRIFLPCVLLLLLASPPVDASSGEKAYRSAKEEYRQLLSSARKQLYRENWNRVIEAFLSVDENFPRSSKAPSALYLGGKACSGLYEVSRAQKDARRAIEIFDRIADRYPESSLADDALVLAAKIQENILKDPAEAYLRYRKAAEEFPSGDMNGSARKKRDELARFAPVRTAPAEKYLGRVEVSGIRYWSNPGYTRVVIDLTGPAEFESNSLGKAAEKGKPPRIYVDIRNAAPSGDLSEAFEVEGSLLKRIRTGRPANNDVRVVLDLNRFDDYKIFHLKDPHRIVLDVTGSAEMKAARSEIRSAPSGSIDRLLSNGREKPGKVGIPPSEGFSLRRIVVDAGHGGKDPGAVGPSGVLEKDVVLAMAKIVARRLEQDLGCEVILTRNSDVYLPLEERTAIANRFGADLFISIHANAAPNRSAFGVETFYLNFSKNEKAAAVAARENGTSLKEIGNLELILFDLMANSKINESSRLAAEIQKSLVNDLGRHYSNIRDLGVRQGPFYVLLGATMPSVLVETAFISNKREEARLIDKGFQEKTAESISRAVRRYADSLKMVASK